MHLKGGDGELLVMEIAVVCQSIHAFGWQKTNSREHTSKDYKPCIHTVPA